MSHPRHPASVPPALAAQHRTEEKRGVTPENPLRVLLAEDSHIVSERLLRLIEGLHRPIHVVVAASGNEAMRLFGELQPEVAVLDIALPEINGFDLLAAFKIRQPTCVVVMLSTYAYPEFRENGARLGADFFFSKVLEFERVAEVLATLSQSPTQN